MTNEILNGIYSVTIWKAAFLITISVLTLFVSLFSYLAVKFLDRSKTDVRKQLEDVLNKQPVQIKQPHECALIHDHVGKMDDALQELQVSISSQLSEIKTLLTDRSERVIESIDKLNDKIGDKCSRQELLSEIKEIIRKELNS